MAKVLLVVARQGFRDEEFFKTREALEGAGHQCVVASRSAGECTGTRGGTVTAEALDAVDASTFDAVAFIGGPGARELFADPAALHAARELFAAGKVVAAICIAPVILANAGLLAGRRVTAYPTEVAELERAGALVAPRRLMIDRNLITARDPDVARSFGMAIVRAMTMRTLRSSRSVPAVRPA